MLANLGDIRLSQHHTVCELKLFFHTKELNESLIAESCVQIVLSLSHTIVKSWLILPVFTSCSVVVTFISVVSLP